MRAHLTVPCFPLPLAFVRARGHIYCVRNSHHATSQTTAVARAVVVCVCVRCGVCVRVGGGGAHRRHRRLTHLICQIEDALARHTRQNRPIQGRGDELFDTVFVDPVRKQVHGPNLCYLVVVAKEPEDLVKPLVCRSGVVEGRAHTHQIRLV